MKHLNDILSAAGVPVADDNDSRDEMEAWLSLNESISDKTVEDCLPLQDGVFQASIDWLVDAWNAANSFQRNPLLGQQSFEDAAAISLETAFDSVRASTYLRAWMEFNLDTGEETGSNLAARLLRVDQGDAALSSIREDSAVYTKESPKNALLRALYKHIQDLPDIQQQVHTFGKHLQRADPHSMVTDSGALKNPQSRLKQYEHAMGISNRLQNEWQEHLDRLQFIVGEFYACSNADQRRLCRRLLGHLWSQFVVVTAGGCGASLRQENTRAAGLGLTLKVLRRILLGTPSETQVSAPLQHLLFHQLLPLHKADGIVLWRDQTAILELYHEPLCQCMAIVLQRNPRQLIPATIQQILHKSIFPAAGNTPKQVLLLHEIDTYIRLLVPLENTAKPNILDEQDTKSYLKEETSMMEVLYRTLARCMASEHSRVAERALLFIQNKSFEVLLAERHLRQGLHVLLPALVRREPSWNPTVRKMTYNVLNKLRAYNESLFEAVCNQIFSLMNDVALPNNKGESTLTATPSLLLAAQTEQAAKNRGPSTSDFSLKSGMGSWRPPSADDRAAPVSMPPPSSRLSSRPRRENPPGRGSAPWATASAPPVTVTGVAPWAMQPALASAVAPQVRVTGVAPWAMKHGPPHLPKNKRRAQEAHVNEASKDTNVESTDTVLLIEDTIPEAPSGLKYVLNIMEKLKPPEEENGLSSWSRAQMAETPTYLPSLKFHGLVFGHELGSGAFGSVKYARLIDKTKPRSQWPEYAVKIVATEKIRELGYEASIQREIAVLRVLSHPGIARLVSSFRFHDGAYLVLEYASGGDLHNLLQKHGSLDEESTRFVVGEIVAALASMHDLGFLFGDLKPENIVITETGHIKLTDFGGCRPITEKAKDMIKEVAKDILETLRDGDWRTQRSSVSISSANDSCSNDVMVEAQGQEADIEEEDRRVEGTTAYLPPEVVMGAFPTAAADAWALGCVMYQCLSGRPPLLEADEDATRNRIVSFNVSASRAMSESARLFEDKHASDISADARSMIVCLLDRDSSKRPGMNQISEHAFFTSDVFSLYAQPAYPLDVGKVAPAPEAQWARRQFSSIWAPQPEAYKLSSPEASKSAGASYRGSSDSPITEGEEMAGFFSPSGNQPSPTAATGRRGTRTMLLPPT